MSRRRRLAITVVTVLALAVVALTVTELLRNDPSTDQTGASTVTASDPAMTAPPPTATVPSGGDTTEGAPGTDSSAPSVATGNSATTASPAAPASVSVVLTYAGYMPESNSVIAGGYANTIAETTGTCVLTLTQGGQTREASGAATPDAATTACGELAVPYSELSSGTWRATLSYSSPQSTGTSTSTEVEVP